MNLPAPSLEGRQSLEQTIASRRSVREFTDTPLTEADISQLLWAAAGITDPVGLRAAPSAGAIYPVELYLATPSGFYHYAPVRHLLEPRQSTDLREPLYNASAGQEMVRDAPATLAITGVYERVAGRYGSNRARRYVDMEAGHAAQNVLLQATALGLGAVPVGAFDDGQISEVLALPAGETPLYLIPVGYAKH
jgi:SagB-type dehydrogenase family enzyme